MVWWDCLIINLSAAWNAGLPHPTKSCWFVPECRQMMIPLLKSIPMAETIWRRCIVAFSAPSAFTS
jgi:hypothetical protein